MKKTNLLITAIIALSINITFGQKNLSKLSQIASFKDNSDWVKFKTNKKLNPQNVINENSEAFGLSAGCTVKNIKTINDQLGFTHYQFQQYYNGVRVENAIYLIHAQNGIAISGNGKTFSGINVNVIPNISSEKAIQFAQKYIHAEKYMWEDQKEEDLLKTMKKSNNASYFPQPELVILKEKTGFKLAYKMAVYAQKPLSHNFVYVDAQNGEIIKTINRIQNTDIPGVAQTKYAGTQTIITDSISPGVYRLRETTTGGGVQTLDMNQGTNYGASVDFTDTDNDWNNVNVNQDEAATDAHFGAERTLAYYKLNFNQDSYDNANAVLYGFVHYDVNYANAFWDGVRMTYGDGDGSTNSALTSLDVIGHEITHAFTEHSANLTYQDESGALNESFSDIFGTSIEFFADSANGDWFIGEDFDLTGGNGFRSMSNPKDKTDPDTYFGQYWVTDGSDNGGVHTNSGVQNYWFYLLTEGGNGTNDLGRNYNVSGIGIDSAAQIAYRNLMYYLTPSSNYMDARMGSIMSAEDLYGTCSIAAQQTANAWYAVGVGFPIAEDDIWMLGITSPVTSCGVGTDYVTIQFRNNGCSTSIPAGDTIPMFYRVDGSTIIGDSLILSTPFNPGDTITHTFATSYNYSIGMHTIDAWTKYSNDPEIQNDSIQGYTFENKLQQNIDVGVTKILSPLSGCQLSNAESVKIQIRFYGCDSLPSGENIAVGYKINGGTAVIDTIVTISTIFPGDSVEFTFATPANLSASVIYNFSAWTQFDVDTLTTNDALNNFMVKNPISLSFDTVTFEETNINNIIIINTTSYSHASVSNQAHHTGIKGFLMTGGNAMDAMTLFQQFPDTSNVWLVNDFLSAKVNFCVDATAWTTANMRFDLKQTFGKTAYETFIGPGDYRIASSLRVLINGVQKGGTYNPNLESTDPFATHLLNLDAYAGTNFTVTFESRNISKDTIIFTMDNAYLDNICFSELPQNSIDEITASFENLSVSPNPSTGLFNLQFDAIKNTNAEIQITDVLGRQLKNVKIDAIAGINKFSIDLNNQPKGVYLLQLQSINGSIVKKIIKN